MVDCTATFSGAIQKAAELGAHPEKICVLKPASDSRQSGFGSIMSARYGALNVDERQAADGVILSEPGSAVIIPTGDCPAVILNNLKDGRMVAVHAGRPALTPSCECDTCVGNIISSALVNADAGMSKEYLRAYITGSICPEHFRHDNERGQELVRPFLETFGGQVFSGDPAEGKLDLVGLITNQIAGYTGRENITHDGVCTYSDERLASHRREGRQFRNITIAINGPF